MTSKAKAALDLLNGPPTKQDPENYTLSLRMPGDLATRVFALYDLGNSGDAGAPALSRNAVVLALVEAGLEAVEALANSKKGGK